VADLKSLSIKQSQISTFSDRNRTNLVLHSDYPGWVGSGSTQRGFYGDAKLNHSTAERLGQWGGAAGDGAAGEGGETILHHHFLTAQLVFSVGHTASHHGITDQADAVFPKNAECHTNSGRMNMVPIRDQFNAAGIVSSCAYQTRGAMAEAVHRVEKMGHMAGAARKGFLCQLIISAGVMQADHAKFAGAFDEIKSSGFLRGDIVEADAAAACFVQFNKEIVIRVYQVVGIHGAFFFNGSEWTFQVDAAHDSATFHGVIHEFARAADHAQQYGLFHCHGGAKVARDADRCQVTGDVLMCLTGAFAKIGAKRTVNMNVNESGSDDAASSVQDIRIEMGFADAVQLCEHIPFVQGKIFAENKAIFY